MPSNFTASKMVTSSVPAKSELEAAQAEIKELSAEKTRLKAVEMQVRRAIEVAEAVRAQALTATDKSNNELAAAREEIKKLTEDLASVENEARSRVDAAVKRQLALENQVKSLTIERDAKASELARAVAAAHAAASERAAAQEEIAGIAAARDNALADAEEIRAWGDAIQSHASALHDRLQALDGEGLASFIRRRYFARGQIT